MVDEPVMPMLTPISVRPAPLPAHPQIIANGKAVRQMRKKVHKQNMNQHKHRVVKHNLAKHNLIHETSSGSINRG